jgi:hypothetical protein
MKAISILARLLFGAALAALALPTVASAAHPDAGKATSSAQSLDFGAQSLGTIGSPQVLWVKNTGTNFLLIDEVRVGEGDGADFTIEDDSCSQSALAVEDVCGIEVRFAPLAIGPREATLWVASNDPESPLEVPLSGSGAPPTHQLTVAVVGSGVVTFSPDGFSCTQTCSNYFYEGTALGLTATADPGYVFAGWSGEGCSGTGGCELTIGADATVTAEFAPEPATGGDPGGGGSSGGGPTGGDPGGGGPAGGEPNGAGSADRGAPGGTGAQGSAPRPTSPSPPRNTRRPRIAGRPRAGGALSCSPGSWTGAEPLSFRRRWLRDGHSIPAATAARYTVRAADAGHAIACRVTAVSSGGTADATSAAVRVPGA